MDVFVLAHDVMITLGVDEQHGQGARVRRHGRQLLAQDGINHHVQVADIDFLVAVHVGGITVE